MEDTRLVWMREKVVRFVDEQDGAEALFFDLLQRDNGVARSRLLAFLNQDLTGLDSNPGNRIVYFYKTYYDKIVEEEVLVAEPIPLKVEKLKDVAPPVVVIRNKNKKKTKKKKDDKSGDGAEGDDDVMEESEEPEPTENTELQEGTLQNIDTSVETEAKTAKPDKKKKMEKGRKEAGKLSPRTAVEPPPPPLPDSDASQTVLVTKLIQKVIQAPELHLLDPSQPTDNLYLVYFIRQRQQPVPIYKTYAEARAILPNYFTIGGKSGSSVGNLASVVLPVILPGITHQFREPDTALTLCQTGDDSPMDKSSSEELPRSLTIEESEGFDENYGPQSFHRRVSAAKSLDVVKDDHLMEKGSLGSKTDLFQDAKALNNVVDWTISQLDDAVTLEMPDVDIDNVPKESLDETVGIVRECVKGWERLVHTTLETHKSKKAEQESPILEMNLWQERSSGLTVLLEQLNKLAVVKILEFLSSINEEYTSSFFSKKDELERLASQAHENVQILSSISRHLKIVTFSNSFKDVADSMPDLIEGLRLIWVLSSYYNTDVTMIALMKTISRVLCKKVSTNLKSESVFKMPLEKVLSQTDSAYNMLKEWKRLYLATRLEIENSGMGNRWEFNQRVLFSETEYIASVCKDLFEMAKVIQQFMLVFGPDFKAIVQDPTQVDTVTKRVENLALGVEMTDFDIYKPSCRDNWQAVIETFHKDVTHLERQVKGFIDHAFMMLKSSEDALELLLKFKTVEIRPVIKEQLLNKFDVLLQELIKEIGKTYDEFNRGKKKPPVLSYQPPESGAIFWERLLFLNVKKPILRFEGIEECNDSPFKKEALSEYVTLARQMKEYENGKFQNWCEKVVPICTAALKNSILLKKDVQTGKIRSSQRDSTFHGVLKRRSCALPDRTLLEQKVNLEINFANEIFDIIAEAELMEYLGFNVPPIVRNVALQKDRLHLDLTAVQTMMEEYNWTVSQLSPELLQITRDYILKVQKHILPGHSRLEWNSLGIQEYVKSSNIALKNLQTVLQHCYRIEKKINRKIELLSKCDLFPLDRNNGDLKTCVDFFDMVKESRAVVVHRMIEIYRQIGPLLIKLESLIHKTANGRSVHMTLAYDYWDKKVSQTLTELVVRNLTNFDKMLRDNNVLFQVSVLLSIPKIHLDPLPEVVHNCIIASAAECVETFRNFPRWHSRSCITDYEVEDPPDVEHMESFYVKIKSESAQILKTIQTTTINNVLDCNRRLTGWKKYSELWGQDIEKKCNRFAAENPSLSDYDEKLTFYTTVWHDVGELALSEAVHCVKINLEPIVESIQKLCIAWNQALGDRLAASTKSLMVAFDELITDLKSQLEKPIHDIDDFKKVLNTISHIQKSTVTSEIKYEEFQEVYHVLEMHRIKISLEEVQMSNDMKIKWQELYVSSLFKNHDLKPTKEQFATKSQRDIVEFVEKLEIFSNEYYETGPGKIEQNLHDGLDTMALYQTQFESYEAKRQELLTVETLFGLPPADYTTYLKAAENFKSLDKLFNIFAELLAFKKKTSKLMWAKLQMPSLTDGVDDLLKKYRKLGPDLKKMVVGQAVEQSLKEFKSETCLLSQLTSDSLGERHWDMLMDKTGVRFDLASDKLTLQKIYSMELFRFPGIVEEIIASAEKEKKIEIDIQEISNNWKIISFTVVPHCLGNAQRGFVLSEVDEIIQTLQDNAMTLQMISASQFVGPFLKSVEELEKSLAMYSEVIDEWLLTQRKWIYLEAIFIAGDIRSQLTDEARRFDMIDEDFRNIMSNAAERPQVKECCETAGRLEKIRTLSIGLDECQKSLSDYLLVKRNAFPRFFFLSDDELLSILGSTDPAAIQPHIVKIFDNIGSLKMDSSTSKKPVITGLVSCEQEYMSFESFVSAEGSIEQWMINVVNEMRNSNRFLTKKSIYNYGTIRRPRSDWMKDFCGMVCLAASQVWWTAEVEDTFAKMARGNYNTMKIYLKQLNDQLNELVGQIQQVLTKNDRKKFNISLILDVHNRDIVEGFVKASVIEAKAFEWESQLRFNWNREVDNLIVQQCTGVFDYGYEYLGLSGRLVITPLTDRIYLTITQALSMYLGCAPAGPAGTGKTETTKDLAKAIGLLCLVTNCGEGMDYKSIGKILNGLCQCGAWGCFDEFNRIDISVLSVISSQLQSIRHALMLKLNHFNFDGLEIMMDRKVGVFITMNPGYAGRTELPESVKALFRPVVCIVPDLELICQIMLLSEGFLQAKPLSKKMTVLYKLSQVQLSKQCHYDFGLRAMKSVLVQAGELKRNYPDLNEEIVLMRALRDTNLTKFVQDDVPLFLGLIKDIFPGLESEKLLDDSFSSALEEARINLNLEKVIYQLDKVSQVHETMKTRHSTMIVGQSGGGKSAILQLLKETQSILKTPTYYSVINPKACTVNQLYGILDPNTRDWVDGLLSSLFRNMNQATNDLGQYSIVFDGDIDALWIENMNSVMDDNKLLTLANGERIRLQPQCSLLFEVGDLTHASPATVSRAGIVYVDATSMEAKMLWERWCNKQYKENCEPLQLLYGKYVRAVSKFVMHGWNGVIQEDPCRQMVPMSDLNCIRQLCDLLDATLPKKSPYAQDDDEPCDENAQDIIECIFLQALYFSFGAVILLEERVAFDTFVKKLSGMILVADTPAKKASVRFLPTSEGTLFEYHVNVNEKCWIAWKWMKPEYRHDAKKKFGDILVATSDTIRVEWLLNSFCQVNRPVVLVGETGSSKTATVNEFMRGLSGVTYKFKLNFSANTTAQSLQCGLESAVEKRTKTIYGPPIGKKLVVFLDDLNMPTVDQYGTQQPIAFLKHLIEYGGFYNMGKDLNFVTLSDSYFIAAMGKPGGGRASVDPRFLSKFAIFNMTLPTEESLTYIYQAILSGHTSNFSHEIRSIVGTLVHNSVELLKELTKQLPATPAKFHYLFNPRDMSRVCCGLCQTHPDIYKSQEAFARVWRNELTRVFADRLITIEDISLVNEKIISQIKKALPDSWQAAARDPLLFGDFRNACRESKLRFYEDLLDYEAVYFLFNEILEEYQDIRHLNMVLFAHAIEHLTRIHRVLRLNRGHMMIVGVGGSGKRSMTYLASYAAGCQVFEISITRSYNEFAFQEDIKNLYRCLGVDNKPTVFIFSAAQVLEESFLETINNMLSVGVVTSLFTDDERAEVIEAVRIDAEKNGVGHKKGEIWNFFCERCIDNMHIVLSMTPVGDALRKICRSFPGLVNYTTVNWLFPWPNTALVSVANAFLAENPEVPEAYRTAVVQHMVHVHESMERYSQEYLLRNRRDNFVTPKQYLSYVELYLHQLKEKNVSITTHKKRLQGGVKKIADSRNQLDRLNKKLAIQKETVESKNSACDSLLKIIEEATDSANGKKETATKKKIEMEDQERQIKSEKTEAEDILNNALPVLKAAKESLKDLDKADITEIRSFATPPQAVQTVCECVLYLLGVKDISWKSAKGVMADPYFLMRLRDLNCDQIALTQQRLCRTHAKTLPPDLKASSTAAHGLMMFVQAVLSYCTVYREVKPKKEKVEQLEQENLNSQRTLLRLEGEIANIEQQLASLNKQYTEAMSDKSILQNETDLMMKRLDAADKLMTGLSSEDSRWNHQLTDFENMKESVIGNCLLAAAFLTYLGPFTLEFRMKMISADWLANLKGHAIPISEGFKVETFLCEDVEVSKWNAHGLPADTFSVQNGILTTKAIHFPFFIDPQKQAVSWIRKKEENVLKFTSFSVPEYLRHLEMAIQYGYPILFENIENFIDPIIENVLEKNYIIKGGRYVVMLGEKIIDVNPEFRLYLASKIAQPNISPSIYAKATVINCCVTTSGLEEQLLSVVVRSERPDLELMREALIQDTFNNKFTLGGIENTLLRELSSATGNMLDNQELVSALEGAKINAMQIEQQLLEGEATSKDIEKTRNLFRPVARRGAILYFVLLDMAMVSPMYQYSLSAYMEVFATTLAKARASQVLVDRLTNIIELLTVNVYEYGCLGIFETHKLLFSFQISVKLQQSLGEITHSELDFFAKGDVSLDKAIESCPLEWLIAENWKNVSALAREFPIFGTFLADLSSNPGWLEWFKLDTPETAELPGKYSAILTSFQKLTLLRCFRPDRVMRGITEYVTGILGKQFVTSPSVDMSNIYDKSTPLMPVIFILSPGSDPSSALMSLAEALGMASDNFRYASLGQGQESSALVLLDSAMKQGQWLLLQNCHLLLTFVRQLEQILEKMQEPHKDFRLWLTTDPTMNFPIGVLQKSLKVVTETPNGLQLNLRNTYSKISSLEKCAHPKFKFLTFVLAFFHGVVQERCKYGSIGWNVRYDFSETDFAVSYEILATYLTKSLDSYGGSIPWESLRYLIGEVIYGGRVIDEFDRRVVHTYMQEYLGDFLFDGFQPFSFYEDDNIAYLVPEDTSIEASLNYIDSMPMTDKPSIFGLHPNAEIGYYINCAKELWDNLIKMQPVHGVIAGETSREDIVDSICEDILAKTPERFDLLAIRKIFQMDLKPTIIVLLQELERFNIFIDHMRNSLNVLRKALKGEAELDGLLDDISKALYNGQLPSTWRNLVPQTRKSLGGWLDHFQKRVEQYMEWSQRGDPIVMWLSGLQTPEAYLTALVQTSCRENGWSLDKCTLYTDVSEFGSADEVEQGLLQGTYIEGLYIQGASWDSEKRCLVQPAAGLLLDTLPVLKVLPIERYKLKRLNMLRSPVYVTSDRRNAMGVGLAFEADLKIREHASHWILKGVCLLLNSDY